MSHEPRTLHVFAGNSFTGLLPTLSLITRAILILALALPASFAVAAPCALSAQTVSSPIPNQHFIATQLILNGPAATRYVVIATDADDAEQPVVRRYSSPDQGGFHFVTPVSRWNRELRFQIFATYTTEGGEVHCQADAAATIPGSGALDAVAGRVTIPVAGSVNGAFGGRFKTSLRIMGFGTGKIYFRRNGTFFGDDRDPHRTYDLGTFPVDGSASSIYYDDVAVAFDVTGIGSIDIVPNFYAGPGPIGVFAPRVETHVYHDSPIGRFGHEVPLLQAEDLFRLELDVPTPPDVLARARINVGLRTFQETASVRVNTLTVDGLLLYVRDLELAPHTFRQFALSELLGRDLAADEASVFLYFGGLHPLAAYYTVTENTTNDMTINSPDPEPWKEISVPLVRVPCNPGLASTVCG